MDFDSLIQSLFRMRSTSRCTKAMAAWARRITWRCRLCEIQFSVNECNSRDDQESPFRMPRQFRNQSSGCGTAPRNNSSSLAVACNARTAGSAGQRKALTANLCLSVHECVLMCSA